MCVAQRSFKLKVALTLAMVWTAMCGSWTRHSHQSSYTCRAKKSEPVNSLSTFCFSLCFRSFVRPLPGTCDNNYFFHLIALIAQMSFDCLFKLFSVYFCFEYVGVVIIILLSCSPARQFIRSFERPIVIYIIDRINSRVSAQKVNTENVIIVINRVK